MRKLALRALLETRGRQAAQLPAPATPPFTLREPVFYEAVRGERNRTPDDHPTAHPTLPSLPCPVQETKTGFVGRLTKSTHLQTPCLSAPSKGTRRSALHKSKRLDGAALPRLGARRAEEEPSVSFDSAWVPRLDTQCFENTFQGA